MTFTDNICAIIQYIKQPLKTLKRLQPDHSIQW